MNPNPTTDDMRRKRVTANSVLSTLVAALNMAFREERVPTDKAWRRVKKYRNVLRPRTRFLDVEEIPRLLCAARPDARDLFAAALFTGCRASELTRMAVGALDPQLRKLFIAPGKSGRARWVPLPDAAIPFFERLGKGHEVNTPMLIREEGIVWTAHSAAIAVRRARTTSGLGPDVTFHALRHTYASHLLMAGVSPMAVAEVLGHADATMVLRCYGHVTENHVSDAVRRLFPDALSNPRKSRLVHPAPEPRSNAGGYRPRKASPPNGAKGR